MEILEIVDWNSIKYCNNIYMGSHEFSQNWKKSYRKVPMIAENRAKKLFPTRFEIWRFAMVPQNLTISFRTQVIRARLFKARLSQSRMNINFQLIFFSFSVSFAEHTFCLPVLTLTNLKIYKTLATYTLLHKKN